MHCPVKTPQQKVSEMSTVIKASMSDFERDIFSKMSHEEKVKLVNLQKLVFIMNYRIFKRQMIDKYKPNAN